ncbi:MAG: alcohol dehydrogenase catalytic domain-containing protein [Rubripirellula sp.]|nr:alcohol dehydrogenase catalytic domain-containing protein [Rubripirellula sp.]
MPDPQLESDSDAIVRVALAGLCGSDLHPFFGREVGIESGTVMGHEFVGEVISVGSEVEGLAIGDRVCAPFSTNCGRCEDCRQGLTSRCRAGQLFGWRENGRGLHGGQAESVRVPMADGTLVKVPDGISDEVALLLGDNLSTGFFASEMANAGPDQTIAVVGCGTVGLLAIVAAISAGVTNLIAIDPDSARRHQAKNLGATAFADQKQALEAVFASTNQRGADAVIELVGLPAAQRTAYDLVRPGGTLSVIGCHCTPHFSFSPAEAYDKNLTYRTGRCPARAYMDRLPMRLAEQPIDLSWVFTHRFSIDQGKEAYRVFANREEGCIKAAIAF